MARRGNLKHEEIEKAELAADTRRQDRVNGFSLMKERDAGYAQLRTYYNSPAAEMRWGVDDSSFFELKIGSERAVFDAEEFRKVIRWV